MSSQCNSEFSDQAQAEQTDVCSTISLESDSESTIGIPSSSSSSTENASSLVIQTCYKDFKSVKDKHGLTKKTSAKCLACPKLVTEVGSTTSNYLRHIRGKGHSTM